MKKFDYKVVIGEIGTRGGNAMTPIAVTVHHTAVETYGGYDIIGRLRQYVSYHGGQMPYHMYIPAGDDDNIYVTQYLNNATIHNANSTGNARCLAICIEGNFMIQQPTDKQLQKLRQLLDDIRTGWFPNSGWVLPQINLGDTSVLDFTVSSAWETIKVPRLHYHNEIAQKRYPHPTLPGAWLSAATSCSGMNLIPYVLDYRNNAGNVTWGNLIDENEVMWEQKYNELKTQYDGIISNYDKLQGEYITIESSLEMVKADLLSVKNDMKELDDKYIETSNENLRITQELDGLKLYFEVQDLEGVKVKYNEVKEVAAQVEEVQVIKNSACYKLAQFLFALFSLKKKSN